ncbi:MAG TPA: flagellar basal body rod protein FlgC [Paucimonas sp.]|nr:flagellar basal body rod protein FlgC [Paucimonas sp.]
MDQQYFNAFAISASGMRVAKTMLDVTAVNLANMNSTKRTDGKPFQPLRVTSAETGVKGGFAAGFDRLAHAHLRGVQVTGIEEVNAPPKKVYDPGHADADAKGFVTLPAVNHLTEMSNMANALRQYEANVAAMNAAKTMMMKALEIGGQ